MPDARGLEEGMRVITRPIDKRERISKGEIVKLGPLLSKVRVPGAERPLTFWNFELVPVRD